MLVTEMERGVFVVGVVVAGSIVAELVPKVEADPWLEDASALEADA